MRRIAVDTCVKCGLSFAEEDKCIKKLVHLLNRIEPSQEENASLLRGPRDKRTRVYANGHLLCVLTARDECVWRGVIDNIGKCATYPCEERASFMIAPQQESLTHKTPWDAAEKRVLLIHVDEDGIVGSAQFPHE